MGEVPLFGEDFWNMYSGAFRHADFGTHFQKMIAARNYTCIQAIGEEARVHGLLDAVMNTQWHNALVTTNNRRDVDDPPEISFYPIEFEFKRARSST